MFKLEFDVAPLRRWIKQNNPGARQKLRTLTGLSISGITKIEKERHLPRGKNLEMIATIIGYGNRPERLILVRKVRQRRLA